MKITRISITPWSVLSAGIWNVFRFLQTGFCSFTSGFGNLIHGALSPDQDLARASDRGTFVSRAIRLGLVAVFLGQAAAVAAPAHAEKIYAPDYLWERGIAKKTEPIDIANAHVGIPYRDDGALDSKGRFTTFEDPGRLFNTPGLNCSGLVVSVCRFLFDKNWTLEQVMKDPQGNSGATSSLGKDWDFGWDLILNLTEGYSPRPVMPDGRSHTVADVDGLNSRGFDLHDRNAWRKVLGQMRSGCVYLGSISKLTRKPGYRVLHYHVVLMLPDSKGGVWLYHATRRSNVHRMDMNTQKGMSRFMSEFTGARDDGKRMIILEARLPQLTSDANSPGALRDSKSLPGTGRDQEKTAGTKVADSPRASQEGPVSALARSIVPEAPTDKGNPPAGAAATTPVAKEPAAAEQVINHLAGRVFKPISGLNTAIPRFADDKRDAVRFWFRNVTPVPRDLEILIKGPDGEQDFRGKLAAEGPDLVVRYPADFGKISSSPLKLGQYRADVRVDGAPWLADIFEVAVPREAAPKILRVSAPSTVPAGKTFTVKIEAENRGAESDYGGITVSTPASSGLRLRSATPGRVFPAGSTVLSVTSDKIRTKVPMAERWIELWGENTAYDLTVKIDAGRPGTYPLFVRCALRGVNVKSSVILMDPKSSETVDQQGFPVYVHYIKVQ